LSQFNKNTAQRVFNPSVLKVNYNTQCDAERTTLQKTSAKNMQSNGQPFKLPRSSEYTGHLILTPKV